MQRGRGSKRVFTASWDLLAWLISAPAATLLRYDFAPPISVLLISALFGLIAGITQVFVGSILGLYRGRYIVASFEETIAVLTIALATTVSGFIFMLFIAPPEYARSIPLIAGGISLVLMVGGRAVRRFWFQRLALRRDGQRILIYGAGDLGEQIATLLLSASGGEGVPVGFLDDDPDKSRLRIRGVRVMGRILDLEAVHGLTRASVLLVAIPGVNSQKLSELDRRCQTLGMVLRVLPSTSELVGGAVKLGDISEVTEEDLLGRRPISTNEDSIFEFICGRRVLITGAGGSIGSEISRQVLRYGPSSLGLLDRDESALHALQLSINGQGLLTESGLLLGDIRDAQRLSDIFQEFKPEIVFHAAALKHLPLLEAAPSEAFKTNVLGTLNVVESALNCGASIVVNISTDKAAQPTSILGFSKLLTERICVSFSEATSSRITSVRFGNVLGSRGSVIDTFRYQIAHGGPVTVTDEDVTRFFMTIPEAVHLVIQASAIGQSGETLVLDMGTPVKIADVARYMIDRSGRDVAIKFTGLRHGEKLHEILVDPDVESSSPIHPLISHIRCSPCDIEEIRRISESSNEYEMTLRLKATALGT
jgi:FlaA1/EpsC-like NDP-sugar epimerase